MISYSAIERVLAGHIVIIVNGGDILSHFPVLPEPTFYPKHTFRRLLGERFGHEIIG